MYFVRRSRSVFLAVALLGGLVLAAALLGGLARGAPAVVAAPSLTLGSPGNENWTAFATGPNNTVNALAVDNAGNLYAGGAFTQAGGLTVNRIAKWDGASWSAVGTGTGASSVVRALIFDSAGNLYMGGDFATVDGVTVNFIAKWNGTSWSALCDPGPVCGVSRGTVRGLAVDSSNNLYVAGDFTSAGACSSGCAGIAKWDPTANGGAGGWSSVGGGTNTGCTIYDVEFDPVGNNLYIAGSNDFTRTDPGGVNLAVSRVAQWNFASSTWSALGGGASSNAYGWAIDSKGNAYLAFGGSYVYNTGPVTLTVNRVAKWDPTAGAWSALCNGSNCGLSGGTGRAVVVDNADNLYIISSNTYAGGVTVNYIAKWDGSAWSAMGNGLGANTPYALAYKDGNLYVGGGFTTLGNGSATTRVARWTAADGKAVGGTGTFVFYPPAAAVSPTLPVTITVTTQGDLARINMQRYNKSHANATGPGEGQNLKTGYYWEIEGLNAGGNPASGFSVNLTLPANGFTPDDNDKVCKYTGGGGAGWDCAMSSYDASSITRNGVTSFSDWAAGDNVGPTNVVLTDFRAAGTGYGSWALLALGVLGVSLGGAVVTRIIRRRLQ